MPTNIQGGIAYKVSPEFTVAADLQFVMWSAYDKLNIAIADGPAAPALLGGRPLQTSSVQIKDWVDSFLYRVGAEYTMDLLTLRAGFIYDGTPQITPSVEPMLPDANRIEFTIGVGYKVSDMITVDAAYQYISSANRTGSFTSPPTYTGNYKSTANLIGFNIGLQL
jgi:long-chain fatty acid transport protein